MKKSIKILLLSLIIIATMTACGSKEEKISSQMKKYLYEKYGEEFVVDTIGYRTANKDKFYQARIYPKSIIGTPKEDDDYYYGSASIDVNTFGILSKETGDSYSFINRNDDVEKYLMPKAIELFGDRIRMKVDVKHEVTGDGSWWAGYKSSSLAEMRKDVKENPKTTRIVLGIAIYVFDKIDSEEEKEERRKEIFDFIQYLKKEGLFEYLNFDVIYLDELVLTDEFQNESLFLDDDVQYSIDGAEVNLPSKKIINSIFKESKDEFIKMDASQIKKKISLIKKSELSYQELAKYGAQMSIEIYSSKLAKEEYKVAVENNEIKISDYKKLKDIKINTEKKYLFNSEVIIKESNE